MRRFLLVVGLFALAYQTRAASFHNGNEKKQNIDARSGETRDTQGRAPLTLEALLLIVDSHFPLIASAMQDQSKAQADSLASEGGFDPVFKSAAQATPGGEYENRSIDAVVEQPTSLWGTKFYTGYRLGRGSFGPYDEKLLTNDGGEIRAGFEVPLLRGGAIDERRARLAMAGTGLEASDLSVASQKLDARRMATQRYLDWLATGGKLKITKNLLKLAKDRDTAMRLRVRQGDAAAIEQVDNERSVLQREAALVSAERVFSKAGLELSLFYRDQDGHPIQPAEDILPIDDLMAVHRLKGPYSNAALTLTAQTVDQHPDVRRLEVLTKQTKVDIHLARNGLLPKLDLDLGSSKDLGDGSDKKARIEYKISLKMELPLFQRAPRGKLAAALAMASKLKIQQDFTKDRLRIALADGQQSLAAAHDRLVLLEREVVLTTKVEKAEQLKWAHGDSNLILVNLREQATADVRSRQVDAVLDYHKALADIEAIAAGSPRS